VTNYIDLVVRSSRSSLLEQYHC